MAEDPRLESLRDAATNPAPWSHSRYLALTPLPSPWSEEVATAAALALFERVAPGSAVLPLDARGASRWSTGTYGRPDRDRAWVAEAGGVLVAVHCFGASPGDGLDRLFHCAWPTRGVVVFDEALDYTQTEIGLELAAASERELRCLDEAARAVFRALGAVDARARRKPWSRQRR